MKRQLKELLAKVNEHREKKDFVAFVREGNQLVSLYCEHAYFYAAQNLQHEIAELLEKVCLTLPTARVRYYSNWGIYYSNRGLYPQAQGWHAKAVKESLTLVPKSLSLIPQCYNNVARCFTELSEYDKAATYINTAKTYLAKIESAEVRAYLETLLQNNLGYNCFKKREKANFLLYSNNALKTYQKYEANNWNSLSRLLPFIYNNLGHAFILNNQPLEALPYFKKAQKLWKHKPQELAKLLLNMGHYYGKIKDREKQHYYYWKSRDILFNTFGYQNPNIGIVYYRLGDFHLELEEFDKALQQYQTALQILVPSFEDSTIERNPDISPQNVSSALFDVLEFKANALFKKYEAQLQLKDLLASVNTYLHAIRVADLLLLNFNVESSKFAWSDKARAIYEKALLCLTTYWSRFPTAYQKIAYDLMEKSHATLLRLSISDTLAKVTTDIPSTLLEEETNLRLTITEVKMQMLRAEATELSELQQTLQRLWEEFEVLTHHIHEQSPNYYKLKYETDSIVDLSTIQERLDTTTTILTYFIGQEHIFILVLDKTHFALETLKKPKNCQLDTEKFIEGIDSVDFDLFATYAHRLYQTFIQPVESYLVDKERLIVIPDDFLHNIPFEALIHSRPSTEYFLLPYLIEDFDISYHYSSSLLLQYEKKVYANASSFLGVVPVFEKDEEFQGEKIAILNASKEAAKNIQNIFPHASFLWKKEANIEEVKQKIQEGYQYIWIVSHGYFDKKNPEKCGILLYNTQQQELDLFPMQEAYTLQLHTDLIVLDSCYSGNGKALKSEGNLGLHRAFFHSGVPNIIYTINRIGDKDSSELMEEFFQLIKQEIPYYLALSAIKRKRSQNENLVPGDWAKHLLIGRI